MTVRARVIAAGLLPTLAVALFSVWRPAVLSSVEYAVYDTVLRMAPTVPPGGRVVIVDVDERSLSKVGQWPWRRDRIGQLVSEIRALGAAAVALDIIFAEPDRYSSAVTSPDDFLADVLRQGHVVLGYGMMFERSETQRRCVHHPIALAVLGGTDNPWEKPYFEAADSICSLPMLADAAGRSGFLNAAPDHDGLLRRAPIVMELDGRVYPSLALASVSAIAGYDDMALRVGHVNSSWLALSRTHSDPDGGHSGNGVTTHEVPLDGKGNLLIRYRGEKRTFPYYSAVDVLGRQVAAGTFENKIVLVGTTALGTREVVSTPLDTLFTGVEVQATLADNLLQQDYIRRPEHGVIVETIASIAAGLIATLLFLRFGHTWGAGAVLVAIGGTWSGSVLLLRESGVFVSPLFPSISLVGAMAAAFVSGLIVERRRADRAAREREASRRLMVQSLLSLTEIRDAETGRHSRRTREYTSVLVQELLNHPDYHGYLTPERVELLVSLAPLHDIGKVGVPDHVLNKPGELTPEELAEMRKHPIHGRDVIVKAERDTGVTDDLTLAIAKDIVYTHHERWDGAGYPQGLRGTTIPIPGRVMALVDVYDAVRTRTLYAPRMSQEKAVALIVKGRGTHFDPAVVDAFLRVAPEFERVSDAAELTG